MAFYQWKLFIINGILPVFHGKWYFTSGKLPQEMAFYQWKPSIKNGVLPVKILPGNGNGSIGNGILPVETFHNKWYFTSFPWEMVFYQWKLLHASFIWKIGLFLPPETYFNFSSRNSAKFKMAVVMLNHGKCNDILPVEIFHRKWHFTSGNFPQEMEFHQWKFSMGNGTLPLETIHKKWHFTSGIFP